MKVETTNLNLATTLPGSDRDSNTVDCGASPWSKPSHYQSANISYLFHIFYFLNILLYSARSSISFPPLIPSSLPPLTTNTTTTTTTNKRNMTMENPQYKPSLITKTNLYYTNGQVLKTISHFSFLQCIAVLEEGWNKKKFHRKRYYVVNITIVSL